MKEGSPNISENPENKDVALRDTTSIADEVNKATLINKEAVRSHMFQDYGYIEAIDDLKNNSRNLDYSRCLYP